MAQTQHTPGGAPRLQQHSFGMQLCASPLKSTADRRQGEHVSWKVAEVVKDLARRLALRATTFVLCTQELPESPDPSWPAGAGEPHKMSSPPPAMLLPKKSSSESVGSSTLTDDGPLPCSCSAAASCLSTPFGSAVYGSFTGTRPPPPPQVAVPTAPPGGRLGARVALRQQSPAGDVSRSRMYHARPTNIFPPAPLTRASPAASAHTSPAASAHTSPADAGRATADGWYSSEDDDDDDEAPLVLGINWTLTPSASTSPRRLTPSGDALTRARSAHTLPVTHTHSAAGNSVSSGSGGGSGGDVASPSLLQLLSQLQRHHVARIELSPSSSALSATRRRNQSSPALAVFSAAPPMVPVPDKLRSPRSGELLRHTLSSNAAVAAASAPLAPPASPSLRSPLGTGALPSSTFARGSLGSRADTRGSAGEAQWVCDLESARSSP